MIDIANDNLDNEMNIEKYNMKMLKFRGSNNNVKHSILLENIKENKQINTDIQSNHNPKYLEYWRNIFPNKTDNELEEYRVKWGKENPKYLKFKNL